MFKRLQLLICIMLCSFALTYANETALSTMKPEELEENYKQKSKEAYELIKNIKETKPDDPEYEKMLLRVKALRKELADITIMKGKKSFTRDIQSMMASTNSITKKNQEYAQKKLTEKGSFKELWQTVDNVSIKTQSSNSFYYIFKQRTINEWEVLYKKYYKDILNFNNPATFDKDIKAPPFPLTFPPFNLLPADTTQKDLSKYILTYAIGVNKEDARMIPLLITRIVSITELTYKATQNGSTSLPDENPLSLPLVAPKYRFPKFYSINSLPTILNIFKTFQTLKIETLPLQLVYAEIDQKHIKDIFTFLGECKITADFVGCGKKGEKINFIAFRNKIVDDGCQAARQMLGDKYMDYINKREKGQKANSKDTFEMLNLVPAYKLYLRQKYNYAKTKEEQYKYAKMLIVEGDIYALPVMLEYLNNKQKHDEVHAMLSVFVKRHFSFEQYHRVLDELDVALKSGDNTEEADEEIEKLYLQVEEYEKKEDDKKKEGDKTEVEW